MSKATREYTASKLSREHGEVLAELRNVSFVRGGKQILSDINIQLLRGQITTVIGPNGAGKSTIAKMFAGLVRPDQGQIERQTDSVGYVPQHLQINPAMPLSAIDFVRLANRCSVSEANKALQRVSAAHVAKQPMLRLSGGEVQRVLIARALIRQPQLLILDEPAQGVDVNGQDQIYALIADIRDELNCAVLLISHDLHLVMAESDHVVCVHHHVCCDGTPAAVQNDPAFVGIFGDKTVYEPQHIAPYIHHHDHDHGPGGEVGHVHGESCQHGSHQAKGDEHDR